MLTALYAVLGDHDLAVVYIPSAENLADDLSHLRPVADDRAAASVERLQAS